MQTPGASRRRWSGASPKRSRVAAR